MIGPPAHKRLMKTRGIDSHVLPDFLIVGAMKAGTSSLSFYLGQHPDIFMPQEELKFFTSSKNWRRGVRWYSSRFRGSANESCIGEKSPGCSYQRTERKSAEIVRRIHSIVPGIRLLWLLRNPVDRAYSLFWHLSSNGMERGSFEASLRRRSRDGTLRRSAYVEGGQYLVQIARFMELFPRDQMHFVVSEYLFEDPAGTLRDIYAFLGVDPGFRAERIHEAINSGRLLPRAFYTQAFLTRLIARVNRRLANRFQRATKKLSSVERPPMRNVTRFQLDAVFAPHNNWLSEFLGVDVAGLWGGPAG